MSTWDNGIAEWIENDTAYLSIAFSWKIYDAYQKAVWYKQQGYKVRAGGPGAFYNYNILSGVAEIGGSVNALPHHNENACIASRGCDIGCNFCLVPKMEGKEFILIPEFTPKPILCDNNISGLPVEYQNYIIEKYTKHCIQLLDANSGFEPKTFDEDTYARWKIINKGPWRFAYDETKEEQDVYKVFSILKNEPSGKKRVYVLIGNEPFEQCYRRIKQVIEWGGEPHVQPMLSLKTLKKEPIVKFDWTEKKLSDLARWANRWIWRSCDFSEYK